MIRTIHSVSPESCADLSRLMLTCTHRAVHDVVSCRRRRCALIDLIYISSDPRSAEEEKKTDGVWMKGHAGQYISGASCFLALSVEGSSQTT